MDYSDFAETSCTLIYGGSEEERAKLEREFLAAYPEFETYIHSDFAGDKKGLFGRRLSAWKILFKHPAVKAMGEKQVEEMSKTIFLHNILHRVPIAMSRAQQFRFSVLLTAIEGKKCFFLKDSYGSDILNTVLWIKENVKDAKIVWLADVEYDSELTKVRKDVAVPFYLKYEPTLMSVSDRVIDLSEQTK